MCSPISRTTPTVAERIASGALRRRTRESRQRRRGTDGELQLALAMSLSEQEVTVADVRGTEVRHSGYHEEFIDLRSDDQTAEENEFHLDVSSRERQGSAPLSATAPAQRFRPQQLQTRERHSISDSTIERLTGLSLT